MVESTGLENRRPFTRTVGSNPTPSAIFNWIRIDVCRGGGKGDSNPLLGEVRRKRTFQRIDKGLGHFLGLTKSRQRLPSLALAYRHASTATREVMSV